MAISRFFKHPQIIVQREGQIAFAAAEVDDPQRTLRRQIAEGIVGDLKEAVDLPEFGVVLLEHFALRRHDAQLDEKVAGLSVFDDVMLSFDCDPAPLPCEAFYKHGV